MAEISGVPTTSIDNVDGFFTTQGSGGSYNPLTGVGTYTETVPTTGLIKRGGHSISTNGFRNSQGDNKAGFIMGTDQVVNIASDVDGILNIVEDVLPAGMGAPSKVIYAKYSAWIIDNAGKLWRIATSTNYGGNSTSGGSTPTQRVWTQVTGVGDSDTAWTDIAATNEFAWLGINSGKLYVGGANGYGGFGNGTTTNAYGNSFFAQIGTDSDWVSVFTGKNNSYAIKTTNNVLYACGRNLNGMNGNGTTSGNQTTWTAVDATNLVGGVNSGFTLLRSAPNNVGAIQNGRAFAWGKNSANENMGGNITTTQLIPVQIGTVGGTLQTDWSDISINDNSGHLINTSGHLYWAGEGTYYVSYGGQYHRPKEWRPYKGGHGL
jgi:alpha-tubulin suppressor-like RCC1 family protein